MSRGLVLFRSILRAHKNRLPQELRKLGNDYVRNEFKAHKSAKEEHLVPFFREWDAYLETLSIRSGTFGADMDRGEIVNMSDDQKKRLSDLKEEADAVVHK